MSSFLKPNLSLLYIINFLFSFFLQKIVNFFDIPDKGKIFVKAEGVFGGPLKANALAKGISPSWLTDSSLKLSQFNLTPKVAIGSAKTLEELSLVSLENSLDNQLENWDFSRVFFEAYKTILS